MTDRIRIAEASVSDWAEVGPAFQVRIEDGEEIQTPDHRFLVRAYTGSGEVYEHPENFGLDEARARRFAAKVSAAGSIDPRTWRYVRALYGSQAYQDQGIEEMTLHAEMNGDDLP